MKTPAPTTNENNDPQQSMTGCLLRIVWMALGNIALFLLLFQIARANAGRLSWADGVFWIVVGAMVCARIIDIKRFNGQTTEGKTATPEDLKKYLFLLPTVSLGIWILGHLIALTDLMR